MHAPFTLKPTNPPTVPLSHLRPLTSIHQVSVFPAWNQPRPRDQTTTDSPETPKPEFIQPALSCPPCPAQSFLQKTERRPSPGCPLPPLCLLTNAGAVPCGPAWHGVPPPPGNVRNENPPSPSCQPASSSHHHPPGPSPMPAPAHWRFRNGPQVQTCRVPALPRPRLSLQAGQRGVCREKRVFSAA